MFLKGLTLLWLRACLTDALSMREKDPTLRQSEADTDVEPTNQAEHDRPERRITYRKRSDLEGDELERHEQIYHVARQLLNGSQSMRHSKHILEFIMTHPGAPVLPHGGCLYLPNDKVWKSFYKHMEHPFPPLFGEMIANSFYPGFNETSLSGVRIPNSCGPGSLQGSRGCFNVTIVGSTTGLEVYETHGHVGLPDPWSHYIRHAKASHVARNGGTPESKSTGSEDWGSRCGRELPEVPAAARLEIPTRYVVCRRSDSDNSITEEHVREQNRWASEAFSGKTPWERMEFDDRQRPPSVDMQISFNLVNISIVTDDECARKGFSNTDLLFKYNKNAEAYFTIVIITDDQSGTLGQTEFPHLLEENSPENVVVVSSRGFRGNPYRNNGDMMYNEGDTVVHEAGHQFGLYHSFEGGCSGSDDYVDDTEKESMPHYHCVRDSSCGRGADPVHNFMDYTPDTCMVGFTEGQKRRAWCELQNHRAGLYQKSLKNS